MGEVYKITCIPTEKIYIGKVVSISCSGKKRGTWTRWRSHVSEATRNKAKSQCTYLNNAIRKYGEKAFNIEVLHFTENESELNELEQGFIKEYNCVAPNGYNLTHGGEGNRCSEITRQKMSAWQKGKPKSEEHKKSLSNYAKNRPPEHAEKIRQVHLGSKRTHETKKKMSLSRMKLTEKDYEDIVRLYNEGMKPKKLCELYNISDAHCRRIRKGWRPTI